MPLMEESESQHHNQWMMQYALDSSRITRIRKERKSLSEYVRESRKEMVSGESHFVNGKVPLELVEANEPRYLSRVTQSC